MTKAFGGGCGYSFLPSSFRPKVHPQERMRGHGVLGFCFKTEFNFHLGTIWSRALNGGRSVVVVTTSSHNTIYIYIFISQEQGKYRLLSKSLFIMSTGSRRSQVASKSFLVCSTLGKCPQEQVAVFALSLDPECL